MVKRHRRADMPWSLKPRDFVTMIESATLSYERTGESRLGLELRQSA